jgi:cellulose 1,4-beta-cellobiosidase
VRLDPRFFIILPIIACGSDGGNTPNGAPPAAVASVVATVTNGDIQVSWQPVPGAVSYNVYMASQAGVTSTNVTTLPGNMTHPGFSLPLFDHPPGLEADSTYYFVVTAQNAVGESVESCEVAARITGAVGGNC